MTPHMKKRQSGVGAQVLRYLADRRNLETALEDVAKDCNLTVDQVRSAVSNLICRNGFTIDRPTRDFVVYRHGPSGANGSSGPVPVTAKAKVVAMVDEKRLLVSVEDRLYVATPLELPL